MPESAVAAAPVEVAASLAVEAVTPHPNITPVVVTSEKAVAKVKIDLKTSRLTSKPSDHNLNKKASVGFSGVDNNNTIINNVQLQHDQQDSNQDLGNRVSTPQEVVSVSKDLNNQVMIFGKGLGDVQ